MDKLAKAQHELRQMDELAAGSSAFHRLHPLSKLAVTVFYIALVVSFPKYDLTGLVVMLLYPVLAFQAAELRIRDCFYKLRVVLPLVCAVGLANPFFDRAPMLYLGSVSVPGGVVSMLTLMMKGVFSLMASFLLIATTKIDALCAALRQLHVPQLITSLFLLTYRYISVLLEEASAMATAYRLRAPGQKGVHISAWGPFLGQLLLRSMDRAQELYGSMLLRGYRGEFPYCAPQKARIHDVLFSVCSIASFIPARLVNLPQLLGALFTGG